MRRGSYPVPRFHINDSDSSPEPNRLPPPPPTNECHFYTNISPLPEKAEPCTQRITVTGHSSRRQLFTSPHSDQQQETMLSEASLTAYSNVHGHSDKHVNALQTPTSEKEFKLGSPSEHVQECLANPIELDSTHVQQCLANPIELDSTHSTNSQSGRSGPHEAISQTDDGDTRTRHLPCLLLSKRTQEGQPFSARKVDESDKRTDERSDEFSESTPKDLGIAVPNTCLHPDSGDKSPPEGNKGGGYDKQARICQPPSELEKIVDASDDHYISSRSVPIKEAMDKNQSQCGMDRNFQFEIANDSRSSTRCRSYTSENPTYNFAGLKLPDSQAFSDAKQKGVCSSWQAGSSYGRPITFNSHLRPSEMVRFTVNVVSSSVSAPSISSVGLDMNRVGGYMKPVSQFSHDVPRKSNSSSADKFLDHCGELPDNQIIMAATSENLYSTNMEPSNDLPYLTQFEEHPALCEESMSVVQSSSICEELNQFSPERKRKNTAITSESDDCKLCNCKKSKCLKLYCECFAAGIYCLDSCACNNCYNKLDYEDTVLDARQQIESRNPHAFAPKVITHAVDSPRNMIDRNGATPSSGRHKRGCNCKKSKCRKKYCECYQSKVGCSDGCRCENCENSFGSKKVYGKVERQKNESCENLNIRQTNTDSIKAMGGAQTDVDNTSNSVPLAHPCSQAAVYSASSNLWNSTKVSPSQVEIGFQADSSSHWQYPPHICKQQLYGSEVLHDPGHSHTPYEDIVMDVNTSETHHSLYLHEGHEWWSTK